MAFSLYESNSSGFYHLVLKKYPCLGFPLGPLNHGLYGCGSGQRYPKKAPQHDSSAQPRKRMLVQAGLFQPFQHVPPV